MRYGSITEWINEAYLLPYLTIGGSRQEFWKMTPKDIEIDFRAYQNKINNQLQMAWINGLYVKAALNSTILMCGLADKKVLSNLPDYPEMPNVNEQEEELTEEEIQIQTEYQIAKMKHWARVNNERFNHDKKNV